MENKKCKDLVKQKLQCCIENFKKLWKLYLEDSEKSDPEIGNMFDYGLSFDYVAANTFQKQRKGYFSYLLNWGGPSNEIRFYCDLELKPYKIEYWYMDWFDGACKILYGKNYQLLAEIFQEFFVESGTAEIKYNESKN